MGAIGYTTREIRQLSSPACSPQYTITIPVGTRVKLFEAGRAVVDDLSKVQGSNAHDLEHYYVWIDLADVELGSDARHEKPTYPNQLWHAWQLLSEKGRDALNNPHAMIGRSCGCGSCFCCAAAEVYKRS